MPARPPKDIERQEITDARVKHVIDMMIDGSWVPGVSAPALAKEWGIVPSSVHRYVTQAARYLRFGWGSDEGKALLLQRISKIGANAENRTEEALDVSGKVHTLRKPDHRTAVRAAEVMGKWVGLEKQIIEHRYAEMSDDDLFREALRALGPEQLEGLLRPEGAILTEGTAIDGENNDREPEGAAANGPLRRLPAEGFESPVAAAEREPNLDGER